MGVLLTISSDAHDVSELGTVGWGVANARRGWLERDRVVNTWPERRFLDWVGDGRRH